MPQTYAITFEASAEVTPGEPENTDTEENDR